MDGVKAVVLFVSSLAPVGVGVVLISAAVLRVRDVIRGKLAVR